MLISEIASFLNIQGGNQLQWEQAILVMDAVQKSAFQKNTDAFLIYDRKVILYTELSFSVSDYHAPSEADIGQPVTGITSGTTGVLKSFDNEYRTWLVQTTGAYTAGEIVESGTGNGVLAANRIWRGPYRAPSDCRKIWGITNRTPGRFSTPHRDSLYAVNGIVYTGDYGAVVPKAAPFVNGQPNDLTREFTFATPPSLDADKALYWVYWREAPSITGNDEAELLIPAAYHLQFIQCCNAAAQAILAGAQFDDSVIDHFLGGWQDSLRAPFRDQQGNPNYTQKQYAGDGYI